MANSETIRVDVESGPAIILPTVVLAILIVIAVLPWGLPSGARFVLPMLPFVAIYYWSLNGRGLMPPLLVCFAGLLIDFVTHGPIGFWAAMYLIGHMCALWLSQPFGATRIGRYVSYVLTISLLACLQWLTASFYFVSWVEWQPFAFAAAIVSLFYPVLSALLFTSPSEKALA